MDSQHTAPTADQAHGTLRLGPTQHPVPSNLLLQGHKAVSISHNGMLYTLQATKLGKLILTK